MRHLKDTDIFEYRTGAMHGLKRLLARAHLDRCADCRRTLESEERIAKAFATRLSKGLDRFQPSSMMDAKVKRAIDSIAPTMPSPIMWHLRRAMASGLVVALVVSFYSMFFYMPLLGSAKETPAQAVVSGMMTPVLAKAKNLIPQSIFTNSQTIEKYIFLNIWCNTYRICEADRLRLIHLEGHNYSDVFIASLIGQIYGRPVDKILPMIENGLTPGQIVSELGVPFTQQVGLIGQANSLVDRTETDIAQNNTAVIPIKKENGRVVSPIPIDEKDRKALESKDDGVYDITVTKDNKVTKVTPTPSGYGFHSGAITKVDSEKDVIHITTEKGEIAFKVTSETSLSRYGESILTSQLYAGQTAVVNAIKTDGVFVASLINVFEPDLTVNTTGEIAAYENRSLAVRGFGAELIITPSTVINGLIERGSVARITATGNDIQGYKVKTITVTRPVSKPVREKLETVDGIIVGIETDDGGRRFILLSDGTMIGYSRETKFQGKPLAIGMKASSLGVMQGEHNQDARVMTISETAQADGFETAGELENMVCLNNCSWIDAKGVSQVLLKGSRVQYIIYPKTVNHLRLNMAKKGQTVIFEGRTVEGEKLVDRVDVVEPQTQFIHKGEIVSVKDGVITLDNQTTIRIRPYTKNGSLAIAGKTASVLCHKNEKGLTALEVSIESKTETLATGWTVIASFDGSILKLEDGTEIQVSDTTEIVVGYLQEKADKKTLLPGLKVTCTYTPGNPNRAVKIMVFEGN